MVNRSISFFLLKVPAVLLLALLAIILLVPAAPHAQTFKLSLDDAPDLERVIAPWDTLNVGPIDQLKIGEHFRIANFLEWDFRRDRLIEEYSLTGQFKTTFRVPRTQPFDFEETRDGQFITYTPRDLQAPGVEVRVDQIDDIIRSHRRKTTDDNWRRAVQTSILRQADETRSTGGLNVNIPLPLPSVVESMIGQGEATNIDISGRSSITFAGETRRVSPFIGVEGQQKQPLFPSLDMRQDLNVRLNGQVGEKVNIQVDHASGSLSEGTNRIRLNYVGFDDDIIKLIELGNTNLSLPGSQLVRFSTSAQGLFGIKTLAQVGPMDITAVISKEEGELSRASFTPRGGTIGQTEVRSIRDIDFVKNTYFFLDKPDTTFFGRPLENAVEVFESVQDFERQTNPDLVAFIGRAWVDTLGDGSDIRQALDDIANIRKPPPFEERFFKLLTVGDDYRFVLESQTESVIGIEMLSSVPDNKVLAVRYVNEFGDTTGDFRAFEDTLALELIKPSGARPDNQFGYTWSYMMRNIYNLGLSNIDGETLELDILEQAVRLDPTTPNGSSVPWIRIFGLDRTDESGTGPPDNRVDVTRGLIDLQRGILTFPNRRPFDPTDAQVAEFTDSTFSFTGPYAGLRVPQIYTQFSTTPENFHRFNIEVRAASASRSFNINAFNITVGTDVVRLDGRTLTRDRDYRIDYDTGQVELIGDVVDELTPSSSITVDYEFKPFAGGASSSLIGFNSIYTISEKKKVGATFLYESTASGTDRPRLGEEPTRTVVGDVNASLNFDPYFLTDVVNLLPLVNTEAASTVQLNGEVAVSRPDPNIRGEVYIDDFEGVEDSDLVSLSRRNWNLASPPIDPTDRFTPLDHTKRERVFWYNIEPDEGVHRKDLNPDLDDRESTLVPSLDIEFDTLTVDSTNWAGVMSGFRGGGLDLTQGQFIELWINDFKPDSSTRDGIIHVELGNIDEDFYQPNLNVFNNEDVNRDGFTALTEDTGLDLVFNGEPGDDPFDDYVPNRVNGRFSGINGTEKNFQWDTEDLDGTSQMETTNSYFSFTLNLKDSATVDIRRDYPNFNNFNHPDESWRLYRINLGDFIEINRDGKPSIAQIRHVRVWMDGIPRIINPSVRRFQIANFKVVGNRWEKDGVRALNDSLATDPVAQQTDFALGVINTKTDPSYFPPFRPREESGVFDKEQSLLVGYKDLAPETGLRIRKRFAARGMDFTTYREISFWVHTDVLSDSMEYFFQIAFDSLNFYEVQIPFTAAYVPGNGWARAVVNLNDITDLKFEPPDSVVSGFVKDVIENRSYPTRMVGSPSMFNVRFFYAGVRNRSTNQLVSGELWLNDIFLGNRKRDVDFAQRVSASINMGNIVSFNTSFRRTGPDFHGLRQRRGSGSDNRSFTFNAKSSLDHFLPLFGFRIPLSGNYTSSISLPKFSPNSDTEISDGAIQDSLRSETSTRGFSTSLTRKGSQNPILKYTFDKLTANFGMSQTRQRSPSAADTTVNMSGTVDYSINWSQKQRFRLFKDISMRYWLNSINFRVNATRRKGTRYRFVGGQFVPDPVLFAAGVTSSGSATYVPFPSLTSSFRMQIQRDAKIPHEWLGFDIGKEINRSHSLQLTYRPPPIWFVRIFSPDLSYNAGYTEDSSPNVRRQGDPEGVLNAANSRNTSVKLRFDIGKYFKKFFGRFGLLDEEKPPVPANAVPDTTKSEGPKRDPMIAVRKFGSILGSVRNINASIQERSASNFSRILDRPSLAYQLGLAKKGGVQSADEPERKNSSLSISMDSGAQITKNIDVAGRYSRTRSSTTFRESESQSIVSTWPDLNFNWRGLEQFGPFARFFSQTSANLGIRTTTRESGRGDDIETRNSNRQITPALVFRWKNDVNTNLNMSFNKNSTDTRGSVSETTSLSIGMDTKYTFAAGRELKIPLPFLRNRSLKSRLDSSLNMSYSRSGGKRSRGGSAFFESLPKTTMLRVNPRVTYNFSTTLNGSFFIDFQRSFSEATNQTTTTTRVGINAVFTF